MSEEAVQAAEAAEEAQSAEAKEATAEVVAEATETPASAEAPVADEPAASTEDVSYHAVEKEGTVTAIWEMQGQRHLRTIDPRSIEGKQILQLFETAG